MLSIERRGTAIKVTHRHGHEVSYRLVTRTNGRWWRHGPFAGKVVEVYDRTGDLLGVTRASGLHPHRGSVRWMAHDHACDVLGLQWDQVRVR